MIKINKSYQYAEDCFAKACEKMIGIKLINCDRLILDSFLNLDTYIKNFIRLDHSIAWHKKFIDTMVEIKVKTLSKHINSIYGSHENYINFIKSRNKRMIYTTIKKA